jgi:hypothetical protein
MKAVGTHLIHVDLADKMVGLDKQARSNGGKQKTNKWVAAGCLKTSYTQIIPIVQSIGPFMSWNNTHAL